ncbi:putative deleted in malignant brain tumors 1 protein-like [Apostichopus japonicus]|uniref:Putative deleted in malignant brain tumors 1 protein-like n=1 Tax=Stichopus japonicus TaxID=307972 RepID=A0A2G8KK09_STIJA|nr:putative deleted in malignant brain tumors 1 protein-like [Apostichopus japonicus]
MLLVTFPSDSYYEGQLRLEDGNATAGRVEIFLNGEWGTVCDDLWDITDAEVVCRQLGFERALGALTVAFFSEGTGLIHLDDVECSGSESSLLDCVHTTDHNCGHSEDAGVSCAFDDSYYEGQLRLEDGNATAGRVEIFLNGEWGTVCDDLWDIIDAEVVCRQLGYGRALGALSVAFFSEGTGLIQIDDVECSGSESSLLDCVHTTDHNCGHNEDAGVSCAFDDSYYEGQLRLEDGNVTAGRVEIFLNGEWGTVCDDLWDITEADVVCRQLGFPGALVLLNSGSFAKGNGVIHLNNVECSGFESFLLDCAYMTDHVCSHFMDAGVICSSYNEGSTRLVDGPSNSSGRVEVFLDEMWGTVCDDDWDILDALVVCCELGFDGALEAPGGAFFGPGIGNIHLNDVNCNGNETYLVDCNHQRHGNCVHFEDAGVVCIPRDEGQLRLIDGSDMFSGRVQIFLNGVWGNICANLWDIDDANAVCGVLGYGTAVYFTHTLFPFAEIKNEPFHRGGLHCNGGERSLGCCPFSEVSCDQGNFAGVICETSELNRDGNFALRLMDGFGNRYAGRVEAFFAGQWGTICDVGWDIRDANVVCKQLGYGRATNVITGGLFGSGTGLILLSNVDCRGEESHLLDCVRSAIGIHDQECDHSKDAGVQCSGKCLDFQCPADIQATLPVNTDGIAISWIPPSVEDNPCGDVTVTQSLTPGIIFMEGVTLSLIGSMTPLIIQQPQCFSKITTLHYLSVGAAVPIVYVVVPSVAFVILLTLIGLIWCFRVPLAKRFARRPLPATPVGLASTHTNLSYVPTIKGDNVSDSGSVYDEIPEIDTENAYYITPMGGEVKQDGETKSTSRKSSMSSTPSIDEDKETDREDMINDTYLKPRDKEIQMREKTQEDGDKDPQKADRSSDFVCNSSRNNDETVGENLYSRQMSFKGDKFV